MDKDTCEHQKRSKSSDTWSQNTAKFATGQTDKGHSQSADTQGGAQ